MELPPEILDQLSEAEEAIRLCQEHIDRSRALYPQDQKFQLQMDLAQSALDLRKKRVRETKTMISVITQ